MQRPLCPAAAQSLPLPFRNQNLTLAWKNIYPNGSRCAELCSISINQDIVASLSTTCKSLAGVGVPTTAAAGVTATGVSAPAATGGGALGTGIVDGFAAVAVAGVIGILL
jgi:hypothetical protein